eukprot:g3297.t1
MPLRLESIIKKSLVKRSERVKSIHFHNKEPWVLTGMYSGNLNIWNYQTGNLIKTFSVVDLPIRCAKFVERKQWIICGSDDMVIRVFNFNTMEKVAEFEAHSDYIRFIEVHPTLSYFLTTSDDLQIKLWDWDKGFANVKQYDGHVHYVMMARFNPKDPNYFASASLDKTVKVWCLNAVDPNFSLEGHAQGVNCIAYMPGGDRPFLASGSDDLTVKIWDYQTKACVHTLTGHEKNISAVEFHPTLPLIISGSEDATIRMWHSVTYRCETTLNYGMERAWTIGTMPGSNMIGFGYDDGTVVIKIGSDEPVISMDKSGKLMWSVNNDITSGSLKGSFKAASSNGDEKIGDGDLVIPGRQKDLGRCELFPQYLKHNAKGNFVAVCGDGEYIIYTSRQLRQKTFGSGLNFAWSSSGTGDYAVRISSSRVHTSRNFEEHQQIKPPGIATNIWGGPMLTIGSRDCVWFYDWDTCTLLRQIDVEAKEVYWSDSGDRVAICCADGFYILAVDRNSIEDALEASKVDDEDGIEAFDLLHEMSDVPTSGQWVGDCFVYTAGSKLQYCVGGQNISLAHLERPMYILGYLEAENRIFVADKDLKIISYELLVSVLSYQTCVVRKQFEHANKILPQIPKTHHNKIARFLEKKGYKEIALKVATDPELKFDLSIELKKIDAAYDVLKKELSDPASLVGATEVSHKWKKLGDLALALSNLDLALECATSGGDLSGLLLLSTCTGDAKRLEVVAKEAASEGRTNVAFLALFLLGDLEGCLDVLCDAGRVPEAAFLARTYLPSHVSRIVDLWRKDLEQVSKVAASSLADPTEYQDLFPQFELAVKAEEIFKRRRERGHRNASDYAADLGKPTVSAIDAAKKVEITSVGGGKVEETVEVDAKSSAASPPPGAGRCH